MARKSPTLQVEEIGGNRYPDLATAQASALNSMARDLAELMRGLLAEGVLIVKNNQIIPNPERTQADE